MNFPVAPFVSRQHVTKIYWETFSIGLFLFVEEEVQLIDPVDFSIIRDFVTGHPCQGREDISDVHYLVGDTSGLNFSRPADQERCAE